MEGSKDADFRLVFF